MNFAISYCFEQISDANRIQNMIIAIDNVRTYLYRLTCFDRLIFVFDMDDCILQLVQDNGPCFIIWADLI